MDAFAFSAKRLGILKRQVMQKISRIMAMAYSSYLDYIIIG